VLEANGSIHAENFFSVNIGHAVKLSKKEIRKFIDLLQGGSNV
jgi:hypothetical protein